jgi:hypothetical protein
MQEAIDADIFVLQVSQNQQIFERGAKLFLEKWRRDQADNEVVLEFLEYFESEWLVQHPNWFEGWHTTLEVVGNDCGLEAINKQVKSEHTFRELLPFREFLSVSFDIVRSWSRWRNPDLPSTKTFETGVSLEKISI